ncbi:AMP-binding protein [Acuticoccus sp.]|uniref:AMP-binding protein n=1 Tax=Acuticoccus sp. TaxID=1904378 RepID=UPI003B52B107
MIETIDRHVTEADYVADVRALQQKVWPTNVPREPRYPFGEVAITSYLRRWARERPDATAYIFYGREITFAELDDMSDRVAALLQRDGAGPGDRVAVYLGNCPQFVAIFFGILRAGAVHVPVNPMFKEHELAYELNDSGATIIIADHALMPMVRAVEGETALGAVYGTAIAALVPQAPSFPVPAAIESSARTSDATDLLAALSEVGEPAPVELELDAVAALNYTGGTTGMPKGCVHTQRDMIYTCATTVGVGLTLGPGDVLINFHPLFWIAGEDLGLLFPVFSGATCILLARWDAVGFMAAVDRYRANRVVMLVDNAVEVMDHVRSEAFDLSSIETTRVSSFVKKLNLEYRNRWRTLTGSTMVEASYGMTETHTCDTFTTGFQAEDYDLTLQPIFVGLPVPGTDIKICDFETGALQRLGEEGELCIRSPSNLKSYWNKPDATTEAIRDGWLHTGDIGVIDESGLVHFLGRRKEMLKVKGMSVFPAEIEALLGRHPVILGSGVIGREDADRGQVPVAFVVVDPAKRDEVTAEALDAWCREAMAVYKRPEIRIVDALPMTATGKVKKHELTAFL